MVKCKKHEIFLKLRISWTKKIIGLKGNIFPVKIIVDDGREKRS